MIELIEKHTLGFIILFGYPILWVLYHSISFIKDVIGDAVFMSKWRKEEKWKKDFWDSVEASAKETQALYRKEYKKNPNKFKILKSGELVLRKPAKLDTKSKFLSVDQLRCSGCGAPLTVFEKHSFCNCDYCGLTNAVLRS